MFRYSFFDLFRGSFSALSKSKASLFANQTPSYKEGSMRSYHSSCSYALVMENVIKLKNSVLFVVDTL